MLAFSSNQGLEQAQKPDLKQMLITTEQKQQPQEKPQNATP